MKKLIIVFCFSTYSIFSTAQITISGKVVDTNNAPLSCVNIRIENTLLGASSNDNGEFSVELSKNFIDSTIVFSFLNNSKCYIVRSLIYDFNIVVLNRSSILLDEVEIRTIDAVVLLEKAFSNFGQNYPYRRSFQLLGTYRETIRDSKEYLYLSDNIVLVHDIGYKKSIFKKKYFLLKSESTDYRKMDSLALVYENDLMINGLYYVDLSDYIRNHNTSKSNMFNPYFNKNLLSNFEVLLDSSAYSRNSKYFYLSLAPQDSTYGTIIKLIIEDESFAVVKFLVERTYNDNKYGEMKYSNTINYRKIGSSWYPSYIKIFESLDRGNKLGADDKLLVYREFIVNELLSNTFEIRQFMEHSIEIDKEVYMQNQCGNLSKDIPFEFNISSVRSKEIMKAYQDINKPIEVIE